MGAWQLNGIALGYSALVSTSGGIAIGSGSNADTAGGIKGFNPLSLKGKKPITPDTNAFLSTVNVGAVSVGAKSSEKTIYRQITHVAAGSKDTDAVNVAQLKDLIVLGLNVYGNENQSGTTTNGQYLGSSINIIANPANGDIQKDYSTQNLTTVYSQNPQGVGTITVKMKQKPQFQQITLGNGTNKPNTVINPKGVTITPDTKANPKAQPVSITSGGLDNGGNQIKNVASGLGGESIDRATGNVLKNGATIGDIKKAMQQVNAIDDKGLSFGADKAETAQGKNPVTNKLGSEVDIHGDGGNITTTVSQTDKNGIKTDIKVKLNSHITVKSITGLDDGSLKSGSTDAVNGGQIHSLSQVLGIHPKSDNSGFDAPKFDKIYGINGKPQTEDSNFTDTLNHVITTLNKGFIIHANRNLANGQQYLGSALSIIGASETGSEKDYSSTNITTVYSNSQGNGTVKIMMKDNPDFKQITVKDAAGGAKTTLNPNGIIITPSAGSDTKPVSITSKGLDNGGNQIHNVAAGSAKNDAVNKGQLDNVVSKAINQSTTDLTDKGLRFNGNEGGPVTNKLGSEIDIKGAGTKADSAYSGENIKTKVSQQNGNTAIDIMLANDLENLSGIHIKNGPSMTEKGINAGGKVITNVGETYKDMHAAATVGQLKKTVS
ncbi:hypothetical protein A6A19_01780 [Actinobacillus delphinicola]|nr:hypothetical protein [Actinobacillus delphinicola]